MLRDVLQKIGLTDGEINIYIALIEIGESSVGKIIKESGVSGSKTYEVLDRLSNKGLITSVTINGVRRFEAASPSRLLDYLEEKKGEIEQDKLKIHKILPELLLKQAHAQRGETKVFTGWEGIKTANEDIISRLGRGQEWLSMGLTQQPKSWEIYFTKRQEFRAKKGIILKHLINEKYKSLVNARKKLAHTEFRFLPKEFETPTSIEVYGDRVLIFILLEENPMAVLIDSKPVADSFRKYFSVMWNRAKK